MKKGGGFALSRGCPRPHEKQIPHAPIVSQKRTLRRAFAPFF
ncbi:hypothetical protein [Lysobacter gummosus]